MCDRAPLAPLPCDFGVRARRLGCYSFRSRPRIRSKELSGTISGRFLPHPSNLRDSDTATTGKSGILPVIGGFIADLKPRISRNHRRGITSRGFRIRSNSTDIGGNSGENKAGKYDSLQDFVDRRSSRRDDLNSEQERVSNGSPVPSSFDFLELKRELEKETGKGGLEEDDLVLAEGSGSASLDSGEVGGQIVGGSRLGGRRQVIKRSSLLAKQVISIQSARSLGFVSQIWVNTISWVVALVEARPNLLSGEIEKFLLEDVRQVGDAVLVQDESVMENELKMIGLDTLVGYNVVTSGRRNVGKVREYTFNINSGAVESLELDSFGFSIIPASLVSTYRLFVEDVLEVVSDTVIVHEGAISRVQRLTKGIWDTRNVDKAGDEMEEYSDFGRQRVRSVPRQSRRNFRGRKFPRKIREVEDDWELPMDY